MSTVDIEAVLDAYETCALWSSLGPDDRPLDDDYGPGDLDTSAVDQMRADVEDFVAANLADLAGMDPGQVGHDFWLTRNRHGAGFWDRGLGDRGKRLTDAAHAYGSCDLYVGDDGRLYLP